MKKEMNFDKKMIANLLHVLTKMYRDNEIFDYSFYAVLSQLVGKPKSQLKDVADKILELENPNETLIQEILSK